MTAARTGQIRAFLDRVAARLSPERYVDVSEYLREEEWQLAVEMLAYSLDEGEAKLTTPEWETFSELAESVRLVPERFAYLRAQPG